MKGILWYNYVKERGDGMMKFDFLLSREKGHYMEKMKNLDKEYADRERIIGKNYLKGIHFKPQGEKIFGYYSVHSFTHRGMLFHFCGEFFADSEGKLHFKGKIYPESLIVIFLFFFFLMSVSVIKQIGFVSIILLFSALYAAFFIKYSRVLYGELENFFT